MALGNLPYRYQITARSADVFGLPVLTIEIKDGITPAVKATVQVSIGSESLQETKTRILDQVEQVMLADAGSRAAMLDAIIARNGVLP